MDILGNQLERLCTEAYRYVVLAAPFIKVSVLERLLLKIPKKVTIKCITRWYPEEILAGVSDIEVWSIIKARPNSSLWLRHNLHAKYYRADDQCLVGSANLTASALGWSNNPNLELLIPLPVANPFLETFEVELLAGCVQVDNSLFEQISTILKNLNNNYFPASPLPILKFEKSIEDNLSLQQNLVNINSWLPTLRNPEYLYLAYCGQLKKLTTTSQNAALSDLSALSLIPNLPKETFEAYVAVILLQLPLIRQVDMFVATPQRFGAVRNFLSSLPCAEIPGFDAEWAWQTLMRWLRYFLPKRYILSLPNHSEIFYRVQTSSN